MCNCLESYKESRAVEETDGAGQGEWFLTGIRLGPLRSDPSIPGHAIALAIKKRVPPEVALDRRTPR